MPATSLGHIVTVRNSSARSASSHTSTASTTSSVSSVSSAPFYSTSPLPYPALVFLTLLSVCGVFVVQFSVKVDHAHPHTHDERLRWQSSILLNLVLTYFALQTVAPVLHISIRRARSLVLDVGLIVDFVALGCFALGCLVSVTMLASSDDIPISAEQLVAPYTLIALSLAINSYLFVHRLS